MRKFFVIFVSLVVTFVAPMSTYALSESQLDKFAQDNILFYDPDQNTTACRSSNLSGDTIPEKVVSYLKGNNPTGFVLSDNAVAGILANFKYESGFNPFRFQSDVFDVSSGYGIAQFTPHSKITNELKSDSRTKNIFNKYYDIKYTNTNFDTGLPKESVPMNDVDAWLAVQLDYFVGGSDSEFIKTKVGQYRNLGGVMGLEYITDDMTVRQAVEAAKSAEDAVRIFVWIMERPADKPGAASTRSEDVQKWVDLSKSYSSNTTGQAAAPSDGSDVTIIGDSITVGSEEEIKKLLPKADVHAQVSKQFYDGTSDNPGGIEILNDLKNNDKLRDVLVFALGTNSNGTTEEQMQKVVDLAGKDRKIIFVTNYTKTNDYIGNNNNFAKIKNDNNNVYIADWRGAVISDPNKYLSDGIHPSPDGAALFAETINKAVNGARGAIPTCDGVVEGGLTNKQAERLAAYYNGSETDAARWQLPYGKFNCVSFSKWFGEYTTGLMNGWGGNGVDLAHNFAVANHLSEGKEPRPFAIFSVSAGSVDCGGRPCGHTGVVVAVNGDDIMVVEANWNMTKGQINHYKRGYFVNTYYKNTFTYLDDKIDMQKLRDVVGN